MKRSAVILVAAVALAIVIPPRVVFGNGDSQIVHMSLCNGASEAIRVALSVYWMENGHGSSSTSGWVPLAAGRCRDLPLTRPVNEMRFYAETQRTHRPWLGGVSYAKFCTFDPPFSYGEPMMQCDPRKMHMFRVPAPQNVKRYDETTWRVTFLKNEFSAAPDYPTVQIQNNSWYPALTVSFISTNGHALWPLFEGRITKRYLQPGMVAQATLNALPASECIGELSAHFANGLRVKSASVDICHSPYVDLTNAQPYASSTMYYFAMPGASSTRTPAPATPAAPASSQDDSMGEIGAALFGAETQTAPRPTPTPVNHFAGLTLNQFLIVCNTYGQEPCLTYLQGRIDNRSVCTEHGPGAARSVYDWLAENTATKTVYNDVPLGHREISSRDDASGNDPIAIGVRSALHCS